MGRMPRFRTVLCSLVICAALGLVSAVCACSSTGSAKRATVTFERQGGTTTDFPVEVVATPEDRARGLMFRKSLGESEGMLFLFPREQSLAFWMKNTFISLDMIFVSSDWRVVGVLKNVPPLTEDRRMVDAPSQYVLEFVGGFAERNRIEPGNRVIVSGQLPHSH
jgi:uncharacterized membrane protein (UPF0127 family)